MLPRNISKRWPAKQNTASKLFHTFCKTIHFKSNITILILSKNVNISNTFYTIIEKFKPVSTGHSHWHTYISSFIFIHFNKDNISLFSITAGIVGVFTAIVVASIRCHFLPLQSQYAYVITVTKNYARKLKDEQILPFDSSFAACNQWRCSYLNWLINIMS